MTCPDDLLRRVFGDAEPPVDAGASFDDIRRRARGLERRQARLRIAGAMAAVVAVLAVGIPLVWPGDDDTQEVVTESAPSSSTTTTEAPTAPAPDEPFGIWPFATAADADDADAMQLGFDPTDAVATARAFLERVGDLRGASFGVDEPDTDELTVSAARGLRTTEVSLRRLGSGERWTVTAVRASGLELDPLDAAESPIPVSGRATAFEGTVAIRVVDRSLEPVTLGETFLTGESGELRPFSGDVAFEHGPSGLGAVVAVTQSAEDGAVEQVAAVPVRWSNPAWPEAPQDAPGEEPATLPLAADEILAVVAHPGEAQGTQDVVVLDGRDGRIRRTLLAGWSAAEGGVLDLAVAPDRRRLYVTLSTSACESVLRSMAADGSTPPIDLGPGQRVAVSPDGNRLAVTVDPDCDGQDTLEIRSLRRAPTRRYGDGAGATTGLPADDEDGPTSHVDALTWLDDRQLVHDVHYEDGVTLQLLAVDGTVDRRIDPAGDHLLRLPTRDGGGRVRILAGCCGVDPDRWSLSSLDPASGERDVLHELPVGVSVLDHARSAAGLLWVSRDGDLFAADGGLLRRDVVLLGS